MVVSPLSLPDGTPPPAPLPAPPGCLWGAAHLGEAGWARHPLVPALGVQFRRARKGKSWVLLGSGEDEDPCHLPRGRPCKLAPGVLQQPAPSSRSFGSKRHALCLVPCTQLPPASVPSPASGQEAGSRARSWYGGCQPGSCRPAPWHSSGMAGGPDGRTGAAGRNRPLVQTEAFSGRGAAQLWLARMRTISCR